jgi:hypothetical protein
MDEKTAAEILGKLDLLAGGMLALEAMVVDLWTLKLAERPPTRDQLVRMREHCITVFEESAYDGTAPLGRRDGAAAQAGIDRMESMWSRIIMRFPEAGPRRPG